MKNNFVAKNDFNKHKVHRDIKNDYNRQEFKLKLKKISYADAEYSTETEDSSAYKLVRYEYEPGEFATFRDGTDNFPALVKFFMENGVRRDDILIDIDHPCGEDVIFLYNPKVWFGYVSDFDYFKEEQIIGRLDSFKK